MISPPDTLETVAPALPGKAITQAKAPHREKDKPEDIRRACGEFEEIFLRMILKETHIDRSLYGEEDSGAKLYGDLLIETLAKSVAQGGGIGIAEMLYREFAADQSVKVENPPSAEEK